VNVRGCSNTVTAAESEGAYLLHISSSAIYGIPKRLPVTLDSPIAPIETYGQSKAEAEVLVDGRRSDEFPIASLRPRALLGPGRLGIFDLMFSRIAAGKGVPLLGAQNTVQLCHVDDFCAAALLAIEQRSNGTYNIAAEEFSPTIREDLEAMIAQVGSGAKVVPLPMIAARALLPPLAALGLVSFTAWHWRAAPAPFWCDVSAARRDLGWAPQHSNTGALRDSYEHYTGRSSQSDHEGSLHSRPLGGLAARLMRG
ncbi:MAG: NAD(P)-dependent oxidoreductase, partial [Actinomycetota bacterium]|nr:NAD(P)-dependent oxidoreductase [Actinomycetota bacterium]